MNVLTIRANYILRTFVLLAVFAVAFLIRAEAGNLPWAPEPEKNAYLDPDGNPYLTEMDSYFYLRKAQEMADQNRISWFTSRDTDPLMGQKTGNSPHGDTLPLGLSVLAYLIWKYLLSPFGVSITQTAVWMGPVLGSLAFLPAFHYVRKRTSLPGALAAGLLVVCASPFVLHTHAGFFDTDMVLAALPLTAILSLMECLQAVNLKEQILRACISAVFFAVFSLFWVAWYAYYLFALGAAALAVLLWGIRKLPPLKREKGIQAPPAARGALLFLGFSSLLLFVIHGPGLFRTLLQSSRALLSASGSGDAMPYAFKHINEMHSMPLLPGGNVLNLLKADSNSVLGRLGGLFPCIPALCWLPFALVLHRKSRPDPENPSFSRESNALMVEAVFLGIWTVAGIILSCKWQRCTEIPVLPASVLCGLTVGRLYTVFASGKSRGHRILQLLCVGTAVCVALPAGLSSWLSVKTLGSVVNDNLQEASSWIRENTPEQTAVSSWNDFGYYYEYQTNRRTLSDGGTDSGTNNFFLARALLTEDPKLMSCILRMLNESGTDALEMLTDGGMDQARAAELLLRILPLSPEEARNILLAESADPSVLKLTHPEKTDPLVLVLGADLVVKCRALSYFAYWDPVKKKKTDEAWAACSVKTVRLKEDWTEIPMTDKSYTVRLRINDAGSIEAEYKNQGGTVSSGRLSVWENGREIQHAAGKKNYPATFVIKEKDLYDVFLCSDNICRSMLVRLLVCEDRRIPQARLLGTWYGPDEADHSHAQLRLNFNHRADWSTQVWRIPGETIF